MLAWMNPELEYIDPDTGKYFRSAWAMPVMGSVPAGTPRRILYDTYSVTDLATDGTSFMALSQRHFFCAPGDLCRAQVIATRIGADGAPLDADGIVVSNTAPHERLYPWQHGVTHDGTQWVVTYGLLAVADTPYEGGSFVFANRIDANGTPLESEHVGMLLDAGGSASDGRLSATATHTVALWEDGRFDPIEGLYGHPLFSAHVAQRFLPRAPDPATFPPRAVGSGMPLEVDEAALLRFRLTAPGLDPAATTFAMPGAPAGAVLDPASGLFQWRPGGQEAGTYAVGLSATDGGTTLTESVQIVVRERVNSVAGVVRRTDGTPVAGVLVGVRGTPDRKRILATDGSGRYQIDGVVGGVTVSAKLERPSSKNWSATSVRVVAQAGDVQMPDLVAIPK
jgi:hypothetical protein